MKNIVTNVPNCINEFLLKFVGTIFVLSSIFKWIGLRSFAYTVNDFCGLLMVNVEAMADGENGGKRSSISFCVLVVLCVSMQLSCTGDRDYYRVDDLKELHISQNKDTIKGKLLLSTELSISGIDIHDSILIVMGNSSLPNLFYLYNVNSCDLMFSFGEIGHSSNEFQNAPTMCYFEKEGEQLLMSIPDVESTMVIDFNESMRQKRGVFAKSRIHHEAVGDYFCLNNDTSIVRKGLSYNDPRDKIYFPPKITRYVANQAQDIVVYPKIIKSDNTGLLHFLYGAITRIKPDKAKLVEALCLMDIINIVDVKTGHVLGIKETGTYNFEEVEQIRSASELQKQMILYNHAMYLSDSFIYLLQDRCSANDLDGDEVTKSPTLLVIDWDGNLKGQICLDKGIRSFTCDEKHSFLYGYDVNGCIYQYDISRIFE